MRKIKELEDSFFKKFLLMYDNNIKNRLKVVMNMLENQYFMNNLELNHSIEKILNNMKKKKNRSLVLKNKLPNKL